MTSTPDAFQLSVEAAELYEAAFVPAIFGEWASHLVDAAGVEAGQSVLDVACGTGVVARTADGRMAGRGFVAGLDLNDGMLAVARRLRPDLTWRRGDAADMPFPGASFDVVLCQAGLMFFTEPAAAIYEMRRVAGDGTVGLQVWASLDEQPGYGPLADVVAEHAGDEAAGLFGTYWRYGDLDRLAGLLTGAGLTITETRTRTGTARFESVDALVRTEIDGSPLAGRLDEDVYHLIGNAAREVLRPFTHADGRAEVPIAGHLVTARQG